jgi:hypothetical protein
MDFIDLRSQYQALRTDIDARIGRVLEHGQYIMGPEVAELEAKLALLTGAKYCAAVASGTEALLISLMALGIGPGDEVITTPFTFVATVEVIVLVGATPVFVDVEADTGNIDAGRLRSAITDRTKAIMPVGLYGQPPDMDAINAVAALHAGISVIEDAAQSFGAVYRGRKSCNLSSIGCTSFFPSKPLGCYGDGGAIFTSDARIDQACREIRVHGQSARYHHTRVGCGRTHGYPAVRGIARQARALRLGAGAPCCAGLTVRGPHPRQRRSRADSGAACQSAAAHGPSIPCWWRIAMACSDACRNSGSPPRCIILEPCTSSQHTKVCVWRPLCPSVKLWLSE